MDRHDAIESMSNCVDETSADLQPATSLPAANGKLYLQRRALPRRALDVQRAADQARAFPQADEAVVPRADLRRIETHAVIAHFDVESRPASPYAEG